jgi:superfamily I DNA/RNA helicase/mRNA-degrading endonuclease RelE of RelBE toxin-antitoxin system
MSEWQTTQKSAYLADFVELNKDMQQAIVKAVKEMEQDPITPRGNTIKKLKGYENVWRYRLGAFRLIYAVAPNARQIQLLAVGPRSNIYERFNYDGWDAPDAAVAFGPELAAKPDWMSHPEWFQPKPHEPAKEKLPRKLTPALLTKWRIEPAHHEPLIRCLYAEDLLNVQGVPAEALGRVMDGLYPATVERIAAQPDQLLFDPEDLLAYAEGDLAGFLLQLDEQQKPLANWALSGPTLVKGGPGSGKSTVALYRVRALVERALQTTGEAPTILFTTYTKALINASQSLLRQLLRDQLKLTAKKGLPKEIRIATFHQTAQWIARRSGEPFAMAEESHRKDALNAARRSLQPKELGDAHLLTLAAAVQSLREDYLLEEFDWVIEGQDCRREADYLAANRAGRGIALNQTARQAVWRLYDAYQEHLLAQNRYTWGHLCRFALDRVRRGDFKQRWDYVIVDETQDLPPTAVALCVELCREPAGVFLTADANQSLYNRGFRWQQVHESLNVKGRSRILRRNYRSTRSIAEAAAQILQGDPEYDPEAARQEFVHAGPPPVIYAAAGSEDQACWIAQQIYDAARELRLPLNAAVVLVSSSSVGEPLAQALSKYGLPAAFMNSSQFDMESPRLKVTTLHAAKGLEFPIVVVAHVEAGRLPRETAATDPEEIAAFHREQRRLFYVGCTRAMRYLFVTYDRQIPSPFLATLTDDHWLRAG